MTLRDKVVVVTGASGGAGRAVVRRLGAEGAKVALIARGEAGLAGAAVDVGALGGVGKTFAADVSDYDQVRQAAHRAEAELGPVDVCLVSDPHEFATSVLAGTEVRKLKDRSGAPMTDRHLVDSVASEFPWVPGVYKSTSGFIHLSDKHIYSAIQSAQDDGTFSMLIGSDPDRFPNELWIEMAEGFVAATEALFRYLEGWAFTKANPHLVQAARENK